MVANWIAARARILTRLGTGALLWVLCCASPAAYGSEAGEIEALRSELAAQKAQIEKLQSALDAQSKLLDRLSAQAQPAPVQSVLTAVETPSASVSGFKFSGDFRYRLDAQLRSGNEVAAPLQNVRSRYRVRLNVDKQIDPRFQFHLQLSTGPSSNAITNDQDMAATVAKHPIAISEAYIDYRLNAKVALRGGRMEEVFADNTRFLWDDDLRFNGFQQAVRVPLGGNSLGLTNLELRAGEYFLSNPGVFVLAPTSPFVAAGYQPGGKVRDANLFHPGAILHGRLGSGWSYQILATAELYRNADQIQLGSTAAGSWAVVGSAIGVALPYGLNGTGNATTVPDGARYNASHFQIAHAGYRLERKGIRIGGREMPAYLDLQGSRNLGSGYLRNAFMATVNLGRVHDAGDMRLLYQYAIKDANSMISQFTDDDLGTCSGVNIAVHGFRFDLGLTRFLQFQNLFFVQDPRRGNDPARHFYVPLQRGANTTFRYLGQLAFSF